MNRTRTVLIPLFLLAGLVLGGAALAACGLSDDAQVTPTANPAAAQLSVDPVSPLVAAQRTTTPLPTPLPSPSGAQFGPITGSDYTPEPLHTPLPATVSEQPCRVVITAPQVALYNSPDPGAQAVSNAFERENLVVDEITTDAAGTRWAHTGAGWLPLSQDGAETAQLAQRRRCDVLLGETPDTTLLGLHVLNETRVSESLEFARRLKDAGVPLGTIKGLNGTEDMLNEIETFSPETVTVYRSLLSADGQADCPDDIFEIPDPVATAQRWYEGFDSRWSSVNADFFEYMNECPAPLDWISDFSIEMMKLANQDQRCLLLFSFPGGNPSMEEFNKLLPALQYAAENECAPGRRHGIALHAYSPRDYQLGSESDVWLVLRHRIIHERLQMVLPEAADLPIYITEFGIGGGTITPPCEFVLEDALQYTYQLEEDPYVKGFHLWSVGYGAQWYDIAVCLPDIADALVEYYQ